ncbi:hypothetical protein [Thalassobaculum sp.]|uniref:hypothetical protein n=1 Tax=Thalassobaculum sp. TaxID=2022740 RepID=UPI0032EE0ED9
MTITPLDYLPLAEENEGNIPWMYLDTRGNVTVGIGHLLASAADAAELPFVDRKSGVVVAETQIRADFNVVQDAQRWVGKPARAFRKMTKLDLPYDATVELFSKDFDRILRRTRAVFRAVGGSFDGYREPAQLAVLDMAFNLGPDGLYREFKTFRNKGLEFRDYITAAMESHRRGISEERNARTRNLLLQASRMELRHR